MPTATTSAIELCWSERLQLSYLRAGARGSAVVLVHGWGAFKELWWSTLIALAPHHLVFAPDLPAHGGSPPRYAVTMTDLAQIIADFCAEVGLNSLALVGHSMGGNIALELALLRPDLVQRLVLVDAATDPHLLPEYAHMQCDHVYGWAALRLRLAMSKRLLPIGRRVPHLHGGGLLRPLLRRSAYMTTHDPEGMQRQLTGLFANPLGTRLSQVRMPTLVITGQFDALVPPVLSRRIANGIPGAHFAIIPGAMHNPMDENPREFERVLQEFLRDM